MIPVTHTFSIDDASIEWRFMRASGPGGQHVNKVSTAVQLRYTLPPPETLPDGVHARVIQLAGNRITDNGILILDARRYRSQDRNRQDAMEKLVTLLGTALTLPQQRKNTHPTPASRQRRLDTKHRRGILKRLRKTIPYED